MIPSTHIYDVTDSEMKPLIGIPTYRESLSQELRPRFMLYQTYVKALAAAGAAPVLIPLGSRTLRRQMPAGRAV